MLDKWIQVGCKMQLTYCQLTPSNFGPPTAHLLPPTPPYKHYQAYVYLTTFLHCSYLLLQCNFSAILWCTYCQQSAARALNERSLLPTQRGDVLKPEILYSCYLVTCSLLESHMQVQLQATYSKLTATLCLQGLFQITLRTSTTKIFLLLLSFCVFHVHLHRMGCDTRLKVMSGIYLGHMETKLYLKFNFQTFQMQNVIRML